MSLNRRGFLSAIGVAGTGAGAMTVAQPAMAAVSAPVLDGRTLGIMPGRMDDQADAIAAGLRAARDQGVALFLPAGDYRCSAIRIEGTAHLAGLPGATRLQLIGAGPLLEIVDAAAAMLSGLTFDGSLAPAADGGLVRLAAVELARVTDCGFENAPSTGLWLDGVGGSVTTSTISGAGGAALFSIDGRGLQITGNKVFRCGNNGIMVWRSQNGEDGTLVQGNQIAEIDAIDGGSGQNGNGVNIFRAGNVVVSGNRIADCAFSAIRSNAGSACQFIGNSCSRLGEVALYAEFGFEGALIASNVVETAASGITITNFNEGGRLAVCANNIVRDLFVREQSEDLRGTGIGAEADTLIEGNMVENAAKRGISIGWGAYQRDVTATGNVVRNCRTGIGLSTAPGAGAVLIANNMISGSVAGALVGYHHDEPATGDLALDGSALPSNLTAHGNLVV